MYKGLVLDVHALNYLQRAHDLSSDWLDTFLVSPSTKQMTLRSVAGFAYLLSDRAAADSRLLVIKSEDGGLFSSLPEEMRVEAFDRAVKAALSIFEASVALPTGWKPYRLGSLMSFQSNHYSSQRGTRIL